VLLDVAESIRALSEHLGHQDPAFTLRTYTHMLPRSLGRTRNAVDAALGPAITSVIAKPSALLVPSPRSLAHPSGQVGGGVALHVDP
jgi:hypothetical protein